MNKPIIEPLGSLHDRAAFSCGVESLDRYLTHQASQDARNHVAAPFILRDSDSPRVIGYYTLSAFTIELTDIRPDLRKRLPRYPQLPAVLLGRLAVDQQRGGEAWGKGLWLEGRRGSLEESQRIAARAAVVGVVK